MFAQDGGEGDGGNEEGPHQHHHHVHDLDVRGVLGGGGGGGGDRVPRCGMPGDERWMGRWMCVDPFESG